MSKRVTGRYHGGRAGRDWLKFPIRPTGSFVVGGYRQETTASTGSAPCWSGSRRRTACEYRGRVGSGIAGKAGRALAELLATAGARRQPVPRRSRGSTRRARCGWSRCSWSTSQYLRVTPDGRLRQPSYRGVRTDLTPDDL